MEIAERGRARAFVELLARRIQGEEKQEQASIQSPTFQQIQQIAKAQKATLVQYSLMYSDRTATGTGKSNESKLFIWVVQPTGDTIFRSINLQSLNRPLIELVTDTRQAIGARGRADLAVNFTENKSRQLREQQTERLQQLHQLLIKPITDLLPTDPNQPIIFIPQGELFLVSFPALQDANGNYLIDQHTILTAPSIQVLELAHQQHQRLTTTQKSFSKSALVVGNPTMPTVRTQAGRDVEQLSNLPGAAQEAKGIASLLHTTAVIGNQATKSTIASRMSHARLIHLATHGLLDDFKGLGIPGAIALAPDGTGQDNDGLLTADEILDMRLNAELVVLSACDTGRGKITGDGVIGLSRSLMSAGVPSVIVSLWKVPDDSTAFLMTKFYKNLQKTPNKAQALRQAILTTKQKHPDPLDWAAFTLLGEAE